MRYVSLGLILSLLALAGCGEDQSQPSGQAVTPVPPSTPSKPTDDSDNEYAGNDAVRVTGIAIDGYLYQAWACLDVNDNAACDGDEYRSKTDRQGRYVLQLPAGSNTDQVLVEIIPGTTIDMDDPQQTLQQRAILRPLRGAGNQQLVTPLTTLVRQRAEQSGFSQSDVEASLAREWLVPGNTLTANYLQGVDNDQDAVVHGIAKAVFSDWQQQLQRSVADNPGASWQQVVTQADADWHSDTGQRQLRTVVQTRDMAAAPELIINDDLDTLSWHYVAGFERADAYELSVDGGSSWQPITTRPFVIGNRSLAVGQVQLRVRAGKDGGAGRIARNQQPYMARISNIAAPATIEIDDSNDQFGWPWVSGFDQAADYEISLDGGLSWTPAQDNPSAYGDLDLPAGQLHIRVQASSERLAGASAISAVAFTRLATDVPAPSQLVVDDERNTLSWQPVAGFSAASAYEISIDGGYSWTAASANPALIGDIDVAAGQAQVRVAAIAGRQAAGAAAVSSSAFTALLDNIAAPSQLQVDDHANLLDWTLVAGFPQLSDYQVSFDTGASWQAVSRKPMPVGDRYIPAGQLQVRVAPLAGVRLAGNAAYNRVDFHPSLVDIAAPGELQVDDVNDTLNWQPVAGYPNADQYQWRIQNESGWRAISTRPLLVGDIAIASGQLQLRVAPSNAQRGGDIAFSPAAFTALDSNIAAPTGLQVDDINNTLSWSWVTGFERADLYQYHLGDGVWRSTPANPLSVGDVDVAKGALHLRVAAKAGERSAGKSATSGAAFHQVVRQVPAPQALLADDMADTLSWDWVPGFARSEDYQWSLDAGHSWADVTQRPLTVGDRDLAASQIQLRVKGIVGMRESGAVATSPADFSARVSNIAAPTQVISDDRADTLSWNWVSGFEQVSDYQYSINGGASWNTVTSKPVTVGDVEAPALQVLVRVAAINGVRSAGASASPEQGFTRVANTPAAPTAVYVNDSADTLDWAWVAGYQQASDYEYQWPGSRGWQSVTQKPLLIGNYHIASGQLLLRVAAVNDAQAPGAIAVNAAPFTISAASLPRPGNLTVDDENDTLGWHMHEDYPHASDYQYRLAADGEWHTASSNPIQLSDRFDGVVSLRIGVDGAPMASTSPGEFSLTAFAKLAQDGSRLAATASDWACIRDNQFDGGLYWLQGSADQLFWHNRDDTVMTRLAAANDQSVCGFSDWQVAGLQQLLHLKDQNVWGVAPYFEHLHSSTHRRYWTADIGDSSDERRLLAAGDSRQTYSASINGYNYHLIVNRVQVDPLHYIAAVKQQLAALVTATEQVSTWNQEAREARQLRQNEFSNATSVGDIDELQVALLDTINTQQYRLALLPAIQQQHQQALTLAEQREQRLVSNPDNNVEAGHLLDYQQERQALSLQYDSLVAANVDVGGVAAVIADLQSLLASLKTLTDETARWQQVNAHQAAAAEQLNAAQQQAEDIAAKLQALQQTGDDVEKARALYLAARIGMQHFADSRGHRATLMEDASWLTQWHAALSAAGIPAPVLADITQQISAIEQALSAHQSWHDQQQASTEQALDQAWANGLDISLEEASVSSQGYAFVKLDAKGRRMLSSDSVDQGWRCVQDTRFADARIWALLRDGQPGSVDQMTWPQAHAWQLEANAQQLCGRNDWALPTLDDLKTLKLVSVSYSASTIDTAVFPQHQGSQQGYQSSDLMARYFYWTADSTHAGENLAYSYSSAYDYQYIDERLQSFDNSVDLDSGFQVFTRLLAYTPSDAFNKLTSTGEPSTDEPSTGDNAWVCSQHKSSGLIWLRTDFVPQPGEPRTQSQHQREVAQAQVCGSDQWRLPTLAEIKTLLAYRHGQLGHLQLSADALYATSTSSGSTFRSYSFESGLVDDVYRSGKTYPLWVSDGQTGADAPLPQGYTGLDQHGNATVSGVHYCIQQNSSADHWTTHLAVDAAAKKFDSSPDNYCGFSNWQYPTFSQLRTVLDSPAQTILFKDWVSNGSYWLRSSVTGCAANEKAVMNISGIERCVSSDYWSGEKHHSRFIRTN
ncbi:DUF1566 domain-containing protein [Bacterioplanes sanyensis]|nr:DUF1566 domain-containing protein [Bacterioplanes sanyensis]